VERTGAVIWVAAAPGVPAGLARAGAAGRWLVTPSDEGPGAGGFGVAGCVGRRVGATAAVRAA
jgi:hypothetical protein